MTDREALDLLRLLYKYAQSYSDYGGDLKISEVAEDLAMSMDETSEEADQLHREIKAMVRT